jgi:hypothetical protein
MQRRLSVKKYGIQTQLPVGSLAEEVNSLLITAHLTLANHDEYKQH